MSNTATIRDLSSGGNLQSGGEAGGTDLVALTSTIGTWVAAAIAIFALIGVVGPYLALQASLSDHNRAMNAVQDEPEKYVSRGFRLAKRLRIFRRIRVPDLSPGYITNEIDTSLLISLASAGLWTLHRRDYVPWNTGWAKLAELIEAYRVRDIDTNLKVEMEIPRSGTLEVVDSRTALVVSKQWIMVLSLLGRYGNRADRGVLQTTGIRRDFQGEKAALSYFIRERHPREISVLSREPEGPPVPSEIHSDSESVSYCTTNLGNSDTDTRAEEEPPVDGGPIFEIRTIYGITGTMKNLGRYKGSWNNLTMLSFVPHTGREVFQPGIEEKSDRSSLRTQFWLAHGFLPTDRSAGGTETVISLETPTCGSEFPPRMIRQRRQKHVYFCLQECDELPMSIGNFARCLGIASIRVLQFLPQSLDGLDATEHIAEHKDIRRRFRYRTELRVINDLARYRCSKGVPWYFPKKDLETMLASFLRLEWDHWGYLIRKYSFWTSILKLSTLILRRNSAKKFQFLQLLGWTSEAKAQRWKIGSSFHAQKTMDYTEYDEQLSSLLRQKKVLPLRVPLGTLFILDDSFRKMVERCCKKLGRKIPDEEVVYKSESDSLSTQDEGSVSTPQVPVTSREESVISREESITGRDILAFDLEELGINLKDARAIHPETTAERESEKGEQADDNTGFRYHYQTGSLEHGRKSWTLNQELINAPGREEVIDLAEEDMILVGLWAANRSALWLSSLDSRPLLKFVDDLDPYVYVV
ncbi:hypothetical protein GGS23DRAFT_157038 [Durotheca rogersii]|uniref:uncharacterized protein n=1 Tax=Durotheca rogersii TaxID=419775 RepID=UPI00221FA99B|nr:uncharacterized protein GGS23DRAFT_157038 [Durotheca rogersii]KAI5861177.1 hypothetical protein GGS23DRAFT_157038 [Durotheca rogersii]